MKKTLEKAPLVHALIHLRFAEVPFLQTISSELLVALHERMVKECFPEKINSKEDIIEWQYDIATQQMRHHKMSKERLLFRAAGEKEIVEISESSIILKSTDYTTFTEFYDKFQRILLSCQELIKGLNQTLLKSVGLRYINLIAPNEDYTLSDFISNEVLPPKFDNIGKHLHGNSLKVASVAKSQILVVRFEELPTIENKIHKVLPDNLIEPDNRCGLIINGQPEWFNVTSSTYGILDVDHTYNFIGSPKFDATKIESAAHQIYQQASEVFWDVITDHAKEIWEYKER